MRAFSAFSFLESGLSAVHSAGARSAHIPAAVDVDRGAVHEGRSIAREEGDHGGDLLRGTEASPRDLSEIAARAAGAADAASSVSTPPGATAFAVTPVGP
jgi:hypothetical protein